MDEQRQPADEGSGPDVNRGGSVRDSLRAAGAAAVPHLRRGAAEAKGVVSDAAPHLERAGRDLAKGAGAMRDRLQAGARSVRSPADSPPQPAGAAPPRSVPRVRPDQRPRAIRWAEGLLLVAALGQIAANYVRALPKPQFMMSWGDMAHLAVAQLIPEPVQGTKPIVLAVLVGAAYLAAMALIWRGVRGGRLWLLVVAALSVPSLSTILGAVPAVLTIVATVLVWVPPGAFWFRPTAAESASAQR